MGYRCYEEATRLLKHKSKIIGKLKSLVSLDLRGNKLTSLPESIKNLKKWAYLNLSGNRLSITKKLEIIKLLPKCKVVVDY